MKGMRLTFTTIPFQAFLANRFGGTGRDLSHYLEMALAEENRRMMRSKPKDECKQIIAEYKKWKVENGA